MDFMLELLVFMCFSPSDADMASDRDDEIADSALLENSPTEFPSLTGIATFASPRGSDPDDTVAEVADSVSSGDEGSAMAALTSSDYTADNLR